MNAFNFQNKKLYAESVPVSDLIRSYGSPLYIYSKGQIETNWGLFKKSFGDHAKKLKISSTKSMTGHLLGAAGGIEAAFTCLAINEKVVPPTINLLNPDPECDLDYTPNTARDAKIQIAMNNSFGFGGTNSSLVFSKI